MYPYNLFKLTDPHLIFVFDNIGNDILLNKLKRSIPIIYFFSYF